MSGTASQVLPDARQGIQSVEIAARVLTALEAGGGPMSLGEIAQRCGSQPSKIHRYLVSLCRVGLATQSPGSGLYDLGPATRRLGAEALRRTNEVAIAAEHSTRLRDQTGHSVSLAAWSEDGPVVVRWDYGSFALPFTVRVGATLPLLSSTAGRVFFALLPERMTEHASARSRRIAPSVDVDRAGSAQIRSDVVATGFAAMSGGVIPGIYSISAPIFAATDPLPLVLTVVFPQEDVDSVEFDGVRRLLVQTSQAASRELGVEQALPRLA